MMFQRSDQFVSTLFYESIVPKNSSCLSSICLLTASQSASLYLYRRRFGFWLIQVSTYTTSWLLVLFVQLQVTSVASVNEVWVVVSTQVQCFATIDRFSDDLFQEVDVHEYYELLTLGPFQGPFIASLWYGQVFQINVSQVTPSSQGLFLFYWVGVVRQWSR